jgi:hypothetical protein
MVSFHNGCLKNQRERPDLDEFGMDWKRKPRTHMETYNDCGHKISVAGHYGNKRDVSNNTSGIQRV